MKCYPQVGLFRPSASLGRFGRASVHPNSLRSFGMGSNPLSAWLGRCRGARRIWNQHPDSSILSRRQQQLTIAGSAEVEIGARKARAHRAVDKFLHRHAHAIAGRATHIELHFLYRRHGLRDTIVSFLQLRDIGGKETSVLDVPEHELSAERSDPAAIRESGGDGASLVVVVHRYRVGEAIFL